MHPPPSPTYPSPSPQKKKVSVGGLVVALICAVIGLKVAAVGINAIRGGSVAVADLRPHDSSAGCFQALMPGTPKTSVVGGTKMLSVEQGDFMFAVGYDDLPDDVSLAGDEHRVLKATIQKMATNMKAKVEGSFRELEIQDEPGVEASLVGGNATGRLTIRAVLREDIRLYLVMVQTPPEDTALQAAFLDGFQMTGTLP